MVCKKMYKDFLKCSLENDWDPYISGWNQDKECLDSGDLGFYEKFKENCPTTQVEFQNAEMINDIQSPGFITVMGQDLDTLYGLMLIPDHSTTKVSQRSEVEKKGGTHVDSAAVAFLLASCSIIVVLRAMHVCCVYIYRCMILIVMFVPFL